jgi:hypothetical protein
MKVHPTIVHVRASKDLKFLEYNAGRCPSTGKPRVDYVVEEQDVNDFFVAPRIIELLLEAYPGTKDADPPEAFQVKVTWID